MRKHWMILLSQRGQQFFQGLVFLQYKLDYYYYRGDRLKGVVFLMDLVLEHLLANYVLWGEFWGYILIARIGEYLFGKGD
jgi:hypothetical protein